MSSFELLAGRPFPLGRGLVLRNRLVGTAHAAGLVSGGLALPEDAEYWRRRAAGGAAMLVVGGTVTAPESTWRRRIVTEAWRDEAVPGMAARAEAIRGEGAVAACQLVHLGRETTGAEMWFPPVAPSAVRSPREPVRPRPLTDGEVDVIVEGFRVSAVNALAAGFQVIELHAAHGYLLGQFLSAVTNRRPGAGSVAARAGILARIADAIRADAPGAVIGIRLSTDGGEEAGLTLDGLCELLPYVSPLADYINLTVGVQQAGDGTAGRVAIVGAGPAGLECAVALAGGGAHADAPRVVVFGEREVIGGQLAVAAAAPNRGGWQALLDFYQASLDAADCVTLRLGTTASAADLAGFSEVILATGSEEILPEVAGIERAFASSRAIASGPSALAGRGHLLVVDDGFGNWPCASAVELGVRAAAPRITVATPGAAFGASLPAEGRVQLIARLGGAPLDIVPFTALSSVGDGYAEVTNMMSRTSRRIAADTVIVVGERRARDWQSLVPPGPTVRVIGDALVPRRVAHAISEGRAAAEAIRDSWAHTNRATARA